MRKLTTFFYLNVAVLIGSADISWGQNLTSEPNISLKLVCETDEIVGIDAQATPMRIPPSTLFLSIETKELDTPVEGIGGQITTSLKAKIDSDAPYLSIYLNSYMGLPKERNRWTQGQASVREDEINFLGAVTEYNANQYKVVLSLNRYTGLLSVGMAPIQRTNILTPALFYDGYCSIEDRKF